MGKLIRRVLPPAKFLGIQSIPGEKLPAGFFKFLVFFLPVFFGDEIFNFHLLEFAGPESEISGSDFVPEGFPNLGDSEWKLHVSCVENIFEIDENPLSRFRSKIDKRARVFRYALVSLEHEVEPLGFRPIHCAAIRTFDFFFYEPGLHVFEFDAGYLVHTEFFFEQFVSPMASFAFFAVYQWVGKSSYMARRFPGLWIHENSRIKTHDVFTLLDKIFPPYFFDVVFELHSDRTVVPGVGKAAVYFRARKNNPPPFRK